MAVTAIDDSVSAVMEMGNGYERVNMVRVEFRQKHLILFPIYFQYREVVVVREMLLGIIPCLDGLEMILDFSFRGERYILN